MSEPHICAVWHCASDITSWLASRLTALMRQRARPVSPARAMGSVKSAESRQPTATWEPRSRVSATIGPWTEHT